MIYNIYSVQSLIRSYLYNEWCNTPPSLHRRASTKRNLWGFAIRETGRNLRCCRSPSPNLAIVLEKRQRFRPFKSIVFCWESFPSQPFFVGKVFQSFFVGKVFPAFPKSFLFRHIFSQRVATQEAFNVITSEVFQDSNRAMLQSLRFSWNKVLPHHAILLGLYHTQPHIHSHQIDIFGIFIFSRKKKNKSSHFQPSWRMKISNATWVILFKILFPVEIGMLPGISSSSTF